MCVASYIFQDLENFIVASIPKIPSVRRLQQRLLPNYVLTAMRKFQFFIKQKGKIHINDILASPVLQEFAEVRTEDLDKERELSNWFSAPNFLSLIGNLKKKKT